MNLVQALAAAGLLLVMMVPGALVGVAAGLRGWLLLGSAPVLTYGVVAITSALPDSLMPRWSPVVLLVGAVVLAAVVLATRLVGARLLGGFQRELVVPSRWAWWHHAGVLAAMGAAGAVGLLVVYRATGAFTGVHQFWDAMFHVNATTFIADTGQAAPSALWAIYAPQTDDYYYPNAYHVLSATVLQMVDISVPELVNLHGGLFAGLLALTTVALVRVANGRPALALGAAVAACGVASFPAGLLFFGPLWPFAAGVVMIPGFLALFVAAMRGRALPVLVATALAAIGLAGLHPSAALATGIFGGLYLLFRWISRRKVPVPDLVVLAVVGVLAGLYVLPQFLAASRTASGVAVSWPLFSTPGPALGQMLFLNFNITYPQWWLAVPMLVGLASLGALRGLRWYALGGGVFAVLFMVAASYKGALAMALTGPWWNDAWRFAALTTLAQVVLIGHGLVVIRDKVTGWRPALTRVAPRLAVLAALLVAVVVGSQNLYLDKNVEVVANAYKNGPTVSSGERTAMGELRGLVPADSVVMNDPMDGSPWMWALEGVRPLFGQALILPAEAKRIGPERLALYERFDEIDTDEQVRRAVDELGIEYVYVGEGMASPSSKRAPGLRELDSARSLRLVYQNPDARIYRVVLGPTT